MTVLLHAPYALTHKESSMIYLLANYLRTINIDVSQITCNGVFSLCDKDEETGWKRQIDSCMGCSHSQKSLAEWSSIPDAELSKYLQPEEIILTRRVVNELSVSQLKSMSFGGIPIYDVCLESFRLRSGALAPDFNNKKHEQVFRRLMLSAVRMCAAVKRALNTIRPDMSLVASGQDFITRSFTEQSKLLKSRIFVFKMDLHERCIKVIDVLNDKVFTCPLLLNDVTSMRPDVNTWPQELKNMMLEISEFLDVSESQISLPLAQ
jgi:hypothetical protein